MPEVESKSPLNATVSCTVAEDLIMAPAHIVMKAANEFKDKTTRPDELWQTDFTCLEVLG